MKRKPQASEENKCDQPALAKKAEAAYQRLAA